MANKTTLKAHLLWAIFALGFASASPSGFKRDQAQRHGQQHVTRQTGTVPPDTASDCTFYDTAVDSTYTCAYFEENWGLTHAEFVDYNPSVGSDCSGIKVGYSYCVEVNNGLPRPTTTSKTSSAVATTTGSAKPSPTQDGLVSTCTRFYLAVSGDTCQKIVDSFGGTFTIADFYAWNPAVGTSCASLFLGYYYCVGIPGTSTTVPVTTTTTAVATGPSPTQTGITSDCKRYYQAVSGDTCQKIVDSYGTFTLSQFYAWNPAVGTSCASLFLGYYYCVGELFFPVPSSRNCTLSSNILTRSHRRLWHANRSHHHHSACQHLQPVGADTHGAHAHLRMQEVASGGQWEHVLRAFQLVRGLGGGSCEVEPWRRQ
jgi:hypothetical protein